LVSTHKVLPGSIEIETQQLHVPIIKKFPALSDSGTGVVQLFFLGTKVPLRDSLEQKSRSRSVSGIPCKAIGKRSKSVFSVGGGGTDDGSQAGWPKRIFAETQSRHERQCGQREFLPVDPSTVLALWVEVWGMVWTILFVAYH
jgi:hypothetical protein